MKLMKTSHKLIKQQQNKQKKHLARYVDVTGIKIHLCWLGQICRRERRTSSDNYLQMEDNDNRRKQRSSLKYRRCKDKYTKSMGLPLHRNKYGGISQRRYSSNKRQKSTDMENLEDLVHRLENRENLMTKLMTNIADIKIKKV